MRTLDHDEIQARREHGRLVPSTASVMSAVRSLRDFWRETETADDQRMIGDAVVVRLVTLLEAFARASVMEFCGWSSEHYRQAAKLGKDAKVDWALLGGVGEEKFTAAELLAYTVNVGSLEKLIWVCEVIIPEFKRRLASARALWSDHDDGEVIIDDVESTLTQIKRLFEVRHKVVHEVSSVPPYQKSEVQGFCEAAASFMEASSWIIRAETSGPIPKSPQELTYYDMRMDSHEARFRGMVRGIASEIEQHDGINRDLFSKSQKAWEKFRDQHVKFLATLCNDRSKLHEVAMSGSSNLCMQRIRQLDRINETLKNR